MSREEIERVRAAAFDPVEVARRGGWLEGAHRQAGGLLIRCISHADRSPSLSLTRGPDGSLRVKCFGCDLAGDVIDLAAADLGVDRDRNFREVLARAAELAGVRDGMEPPPPRPAYAPPPREYPPAADVAELWDGARRVTQIRDAVSWLRRRGLDPEVVALFDLARALPVSGPLPRWATFRGRTWAETGHRLIVPMYDAGGTVRSVRARAVEAMHGPKALPPAGHAMGGLVMACRLAAKVLEGGAWPEWSTRRTLVIAEGEPDFLTWATRWTDADEHTPAVLGITNGSWTDEIAGRVPAASEVVVRTDNDAAGDEYARRIHASLAARCRLLRSGGPCGEHACAGRQR